MSEPIVFISHHQIKEGRLDDLRQFSAAGVQALESAKPRTVMFQAYIDEHGTEVSFVHVFPDDKAMDEHFAGAGERAQAAYEFIEPRRFEIYGRPSDAALETMRRAEANGARLELYPLGVAGFARI